MAEREEGLWMSTKERDRLKVLHEVIFYFALTAAILG